ncbi:EAL domain-containing protein [Geodermatophilus sp. CPCC 205506]|uniref:EAL domain-containing protein n=1 Tax=Geodermatophilus sp. CPCC 205506 TaxID=2936596 RepID=UPI003EEF6815
MRNLGRRPARQHGRGAPLWLYLTALVLIPVLGVVVLTAVIARSRTAEAAGAARAEEAVRAVAQLDAARSSVEHEIVPVLSLAVIEDPSAAVSLGIPSFLLAGQRDSAVAAAQEARETTDRALAAVPSSSDGAAAARHAADRLTGLRARTESGAFRIEDVYVDYLEVSSALLTAQRRAAAAASSEEVPATTLRATRDVEIVAQLAQAASRQMPLFLAGHFDAGELSAGSRLAGQNAWLAYTDARRQMDDLSQESLRTAWLQLRTDPVTTRLDRLLSDQFESGQARLPLTQLVSTLLLGNERDARLADLVVRAVDSAQALAAADRDLANGRLTTTLQLGLGLLLVALLGALFLGRSVSRSLGLLAGQATQISEGSLVEVQVAGPREVRTVSGALGSAVASLRRIQDQAQAVARGDLANTVLDQPLPGPLGEVVHASVREIVSSVRAREELQYALAHQATHDPLTELPNRAQALTLVTAALHRAQRSGEMTGLLFVDLDGFKAVNDSHGHACGDDVLREVARRMAAVVRPGDVVCRLGGDEFVVLVERVRAERDLQELGERLIAAVSEPITAAGHPDLLLAEADTAAYRAKRRGRGRTEMFDETLRLQLSERAELEAAITAGLENGEMELRYQPVVDVGRSRVIGYEALIRWNRPGHGMVPPDEFIPVAEGSRLICDLDRWVLHQATAQLAAWRAAEPPAPGEAEPTMAVNISGRHLADRRVVQDVADALAASGLPAALLIVEITETVLVSDPVAITHLEALREMGVAIAIDDFGTGYTSIGQLRNMPVDTLKIDRSFIASTEPGHRELVALIIRAAHTFGLTVVAEGVEEPAQLDRLRADACDQAQGYLLYRPMPAADAGALLRTAVPTG